MSNNMYYLKNGSNKSANYKTDSKLSYVFNTDSNERVTESTSSISGELLYVSVSKYESDWNSLLHIHYFSEIFYITSGRGEFIVGSKKFQVDPDNMVIINPKVEHTETSIGDTPLEYIILGIDGLAFNSLEEDYIVINSYAFKTDMRFYLNALAIEMKKDRLFREVICQNLLSTILILILRNKNLDISIFASNNASKECALVKKYIDNNFKNNVTLDELASISHLNKFYLVHNFTKTYGISPINYLLLKRIEESKYMLTSTNHSLSSISRIMGFSSASYFSQAFKRNAKVAPLEYRKITQLKEHPDNTSK